MHEVVLTVLAVASLLGFVSLLLPLARRLDVPYTVLLAVVGVGIGFAVQMDWDEGGGAGNFISAIRQLNLSSDAFLYLFLPPLLFAAGLGVNVRRLMDDMGPVLLLAVVAVVVCTGLVGFAVSLVAPEVGLVAALLLGAIVATTDSAAVVAIFRDIGAPARLSIIVEGESLFNDAAAIAIFVVLLAMLTGGAEVGLASGIGTFFYGMIGGLVFGYLLARGFALIISRLRDAALTEITLTVALAYLAFVGAEVYLHVSGVIAVVTAAIVINASGQTIVSPGTWTFLRSTWGLLEFIAVSLIFTLAAMTAPATLAGFTGADLLVVLTLFAATIVARALVLYGLAPGLSLVNISQPISGSYKAVLVWGGLRGAVTVALALAIAENPAVPPEIQRFILVSATGFVFLTLVVMAPTLRPLMSAFGLTELSARDSIVRDRVQSLARARVSEKMHGVARNLGLSGALSPSEEDAELAALPALDERDRRQFALVALAGRERELYLDYFQTGILNRRIADLLRAQSGRLIDAAKTGTVDRYLATAMDAVAIKMPFNLALWLYHRLGWAGPLSQAISDRFEVLIISQLALRDLRPFMRQHLTPMVGAGIGADVEEALDRREGIVAGHLEVLDVQYPSYAASLRAQYVERVALGFEQSEYRLQRDQAVISNEVYEDLEQARLARSRRLEERPELDLGLRLASMLQQVPLFASFDEAALEKVGRLLTPRIAVPDEVIIHEGDPGTCMYFIVSGRVEVRFEEDRITLNDGDFFGEVALVTHAARNADVVAVGFCTLLSLSSSRFQSLLRANPALRDQIERTAEARQH